MYQTYAVGSSGVGSKIAWGLPTADGSYVLRLHFLQPEAFNRVFHIGVNGAVVESNLSLDAATGGLNRAAVREYNVTAAGGTGLNLELTTVTNGSLLAAIELLKVNPSGAANPTANVQVSAVSSHST